MPAGRCAGAASGYVPAGPGAVAGGQLLMGGSSEGFDRLWEAHLLPASPSRPGRSAVGDLVRLINAGSMVVGLATAEWVARRWTWSRRPAWPALWWQPACCWRGRDGLRPRQGFGLALAAVWLRALALAIYRRCTRLAQPHADGEVRATIFSMSGQADALGQFACGPALGWLGVRLSLRAAFLRPGDSCCRWWACWRQCTRRTRARPALCRAPRASSGRRGLIGAPLSLDRASIRHRPGVTCLVEDKKY
jgi:hypothetical protein